MRDVNSLCGKKRFFLTAILLAVLLSFSPAAEALSIGEKVPNFTLRDMTGKSVSLGDFKGQRVILNFWATWCPPCRLEMPEFNEMNAELVKSGEAVLLAINMTDGQRETKSRVSSYLATNKFNISVLLDSDGITSDIFSVRGIPTTVIIDRDGVLRGQIVGATTRDNVMKIVRNIK